MKKIILSTIMLLFLISFIHAQNQPVSPGVNIPVLGNVNPDTGTPSSFEKFQNFSESMSDKERSKEYLKQQWTILLANNKVIGPILFYTEGFFSYLDPFWLIVLKIPFAWSWQFIFSLALFIILIVAVYAPSKSLTTYGPILALVFSFVVSTLAAATGIIQKAVSMMSVLIQTWWLALIALVISIIAISVYYNLITDAGEETKKRAKEEDVERAQDAIIAHGEVSKKALDSYKKR